MQKLEAVKRPDETFDELFTRLAVDRTEVDVQQLAGFADVGIEQHMQDARSDLNDSPEKRTGQTSTQLDQS